MTASMPAFPPELIWNMALRYDHGLGCPDYYDMLGPGEHDKRCTLVKSAMGDILKYVLSKFYGCVLPQTPFRGLLEGMIAVCPVELHPTAASMTQIYEEIVSYYKSPYATQCNSVREDSDRGEDIPNYAHHPAASTNVDPSAQPPMSVHPRPPKAPPSVVWDSSSPTPMTIVSTAHTKPVIPNDEVREDWKAQCPLVSNGRTIGTDIDRVIDKACLWAAEREFDEVCKLVPPEVAQMLRDVRRPPLARAALDRVTELLQQSDGLHSLPVDESDLRLLHDALVQKLEGHSNG